MANFPSCQNATYISTMYQSNDDQLLTDQVFASENCEYLVRAELNMLSLYSFSKQSSIKQYYMYDTVWSIPLRQKQRSDSETLTLTNTGCLTWFDNNDSIITQFCDSNKPLTTLYFTTLTPILNMVSNSNQIMYIPLSLAVVAIFLVLIFLICMCRKHKHILSNLNTVDSDSNSTNEVTEMEMQTQTFEKQFGNESDLYIRYKNANVSEKNTDFLRNHPHSNLSLRELKKVQIVQTNRIFVSGVATKFVTQVILESNAWFGQFGEIEKIMIGDDIMSIMSDSRYFTVVYKDESSAQKALNWINNGVFLSDYGTAITAMLGYNTYCMDWATHECNNSECHFLHRWCTENEMKEMNLKDMFTFKVMSRFQSNSIEL